MDDAHQVVADYWAAANTKDWAAFVALVADDLVYEAPQTRERVRGREAYYRFNAEAFPATGRPRCCGSWVKGSTRRAGSRWPTAASTTTECASSTSTTPAESRGSRTSG